jgi:deoxyribonuclease-4
VAGGLLRAFAHLDAHGGEALQIFTSPSTRWAEQRRDPGEIREFAAEAARRRVPILAHASYLVNLAAPPASPTAKRSRAAFLAELERCEALGIGAVVVHPGAHLGAGVEVGVARAAAGLRWALGRTAGHRVRVLVELTAGQGTCLGWSFGELRAILEEVGVPARLGVCFDTCHAHAAGYDMTTVDGYEAVWRELDRTVGLARVAAFHLNDSRRELGARVDRHAAIGAGHIGDALFRRLVGDPRFAGVPGLVELPPAVQGESLTRLRGWRKDHETKASRRRRRA